MRVLYLNSGNLYGGIESLLATMARHRSECPELEPCFAICFEGKIAAELRQLGVPVRILGPVRVSRPWTAIPARRRLADVIDELRPDIVVSHGPWTHGIFAGVVRRKHLPIAFWAHDVTNDSATWLDRLARRQAPELVICNSQYTEKGFRTLFPGVPAEVIYCPVSPAKPLNSRASLVTRQQNDTPDSDAVIVQVSRLDLYKGHEIHIRALALLKDLTGWTCWMVAGAQREAERQYLDRLKGLAMELGIQDRVKFLPWHGWGDPERDLESVFAAADIFCQPNIGPEPFGLTFVEALMRKVPVVATGIGGALEIVDSTCGVLVEPNDLVALANALRGLIEDPRRRLELGKAGPSRAAKLCLPRTQLNKLTASLGRFARAEVVD